MKTEARFQQETHIRTQMGRARTYIRAHATGEITLAAIAEAAGSSPYHFSRLFSAFAGETVFAYVQRVRLLYATALLGQSAHHPVTEVALAVGYQTPSAFNRVFRAVLGVSPTRFRTASPKERRRWLARLEDPRRSKAMKLDLTPTPEIRVRPERPYARISRTGNCPDEAPGAWEALHRAMAAAPPTWPETEFIGASYDHPDKTRHDVQVYDAGFTLPPGVQPPAGLTLGKVAGGRYAVFRYRGSYRLIWNAVDQIFQGWVASSGTKLRPEPLLEIYVNDPKETPEADLVTEICLPLA